MVQCTHFSLKPFESFSYEEAPDISLNVSGCIIHVLPSWASLFWMINSERINNMYNKVNKKQKKTIFTTSRKITLTDLLINVDVRSNAGESGRSPLIIECVTVNQADG